MTVMREVAWESCLLEPRRDPKFERRFRRETGRPSGPVSYFSGNSWLDETTVAFHINSAQQVSIEPGLTGLIGMIVSQDNSCRFCFAETRAFLRILGMPEQRVARLEQDLLTEDFNASERAALEFARRFSRSNPPPSKRDIDELKAAGYDELQVLEIASIASFFLFFNRVTTFFALPPQAIEELPDRWYIRILRPVLALLLSRSIRPGRTEALEPSEREGIFSRVVVGLDGLPFARSLRMSLDGMWASPVLPQRAKALAIAIVARALDCPEIEREATEPLLAAGLSSEQVDGILAHLTSPALDPLEQVVVPFARESIWYEPARIQQLGREAMKSLSREEFVELVAVVSIANMICRLGILVGVR